MIWEALDPLSEVDITTDTREIHSILGNLSTVTCQQIGNLEEMGKFLKIHQVWVMKK